MNLKIKSAKKTVVSKKEVDVIKVSGGEAETATFFTVCGIAQQAIAANPALGTEEVVNFLAAVEASKPVAEAAE